jgi:hypothetical protein
MKAKYLNPFTDFGFKKIFGEEASKPQLIDFLNSLLPERDQIVELTFKNNEQLGFTPTTEKPFMISIVKIKMVKSLS